jgi:hypothetical protein
MPAAFTKVARPLFLGYDAASLDNHFPTFQDEVLVSFSGVQMPKKNSSWNSSLFLDILTLECETTLLSQITGS